MKNYILILVMFCFGGAMAHDMNYENAVPRQWQLKGTKKSFEGFFYLYKDGVVYIEQNNHEIIRKPLVDFSAADQNYVQQKVQVIHQLNVSNIQEKVPVISKPSLDLRLLFVCFALLGIGGIMFRFRSYNRVGYLLPIVVFGVAITLYGFTQEVKKVMASKTSPYYMDSAFTPFKPAVYTRWDSTYFYVESKGIPAHNMMVGITGWQQQFPIPQCYIGSNAWSIPLNPVPASTPVPVNSKHFLRGAIAIAANGIPIFNPFTNTGVDALLDGQLDNWGGHCGRADDYHYHIAPMFLESSSGPYTPIAFALDGYAVYGAKEPNGSAMYALDANHGHIGSNGVYHYHGSSTAPYMIGNMVGKVTEDTTLQIIPQAKATPVRPAGAPLKGAAIVGFHSNGSRSNTLIYTLSGKTDSVVYSWTDAGLYTFKTYIQDSAVKTNNYNGFKQCTVPVSVIELLGEKAVTLFPNPARDFLEIELNSMLNESMVASMSIYNVGGEKVYRCDGFKNTIDLTAMNKGLYFITIQFKDTEVTKKYLVH